MSKFSCTDSFASIRFFRHTISPNKSPVIETLAVGMMVNRMQEKNCLFLSLQIWIEGTRGRNIRGDIAIDDISVEDRVCAGEI